MKDSALAPFRCSQFRLVPSQLLVLAVTGLLLPSLGQAQTFEPNWVQESPAASPPARNSANMAYDAASGQVVLFGGYGNGGILGDTWTWNGITWTQQSPATSPSGRDSAGMVYDAATGQVVLFGGSNGSSILGDTWTWNGTTWTQQSPAASPSARDFPSMAYDAATGQVVLFGGDGSTNSSGYLGDTWTWNGTTWTQQSPATSPSARYYDSMAYDAATAQVVLFGGYNNGLLGDTWTWNGTTWTQQSPAASPSARYLPIMAYDAASSKVVLFGGEGNSGLLGDTWSWNATTWSQQSPAASPSARYTASMTYDAASGQVVLFGGFGSSGRLSDIWVWGQGDFGSQAIGSISAAQTLNFSIPASTTIGSIGILTQGTSGLDFADGGSSTCTATTYSSTTSCVVNVTFKPAVAGLRSCAVVFFSGANNTGTVLASVPVYGVGTGPQIAYGFGTAIAIDPTVNGLALSNPDAVAVDSAGDLFIADVSNNRLIEIPAGGGAAVATDPIANFIGLDAPIGLAVDGAGDLFVADYQHSRVIEAPVGGGSAIAIDPTVFGYSLGQTSGVAVDGAGDLFIADSQNFRLLELPAGGGAGFIVHQANGTDSSTGLSYPRLVAVDSAGNIFIGNQDANHVEEYPAGGGTPISIDPTVNGESLNGPIGVAVDSAGDLFIGDTYNSRVVEVPAGGGAPTVIDPIVNGLGLSYPIGLAVDSAGDLFIADEGNNRVVELQRSQSPALSFPTLTDVGTTDTTDGTKTVQVFNIGNQALDFTAVSYPADFSETSDVNPCTGSTSLIAGAECDVPVEFTPENGGVLSESVTLTDNNLNVAGTRQSIAVSGTAPTVNVSVGTSPAGAGFLVDGTSYSTTQSFSWNIGSTHTLTAGASFFSADGVTEFGFSNWTPGTTSATDSVTATASVASYTANYQISGYLLTAVPNNSAWGSVTPASPGFYANGAPTSITATANAGFSFTGWTGSTDIASPSSASTTITMNSPETVTANFAPLAGAITSPGGVNFGSQAIGSPSGEQALSFSIPAGITVGSIGILTSGTPGLDFADGGSSTCTPTTYSSTTNCVVNVTFKPAVAGLRSGAVVFFSGAGNSGIVLGMAPVYGVGSGPQIAYSPSPTIAFDPTVNGSGLWEPTALAESGAGDLFIADTWNSRIVEVPAGSGTPTVIDPTVNGTALNGPCGVAVDGAGNLFIADTFNNRIVEVPAGGGAPIAIDPSVNGQGLFYPFGIAVDGAGDQFIADEANSRIVELPAGGGTPIAIDPTVNGQGLSYPNGVVVDGAGDLFIVDPDNSRVVEMPAGGGTPIAIDPTVNGETLNHPYGVAVDGAGDLFIADYNNSRILEVPAGGGAPIAIDPTVNGESLYNPMGVTVDGAGDLLISDGPPHNRIVELQRSQAPVLTFPTSTPEGTADTTDGTMTVQIQNIGNQALDFTAVGYPADFSAASDPNPCTGSTSLNAGGVCDVPVEFTPQNYGTLSENLTLTDNNLNGTNVSQSISLSGFGLEPQTITFANPGAQTVGTPLTLSASASSGLTVSYTSTTTGICMVAGTTATFIASGTCTIDANQAGNSTYAPATQVQQSFTVNTEAQTITFSSIPAQPFGKSLNLSASASSGLTVSFSSLTPSVCAVSVDSASMIGLGTCIIQASQAGNSQYAAAPNVNQSFKVEIAAQTITFPTIPTTQLLKGSISLNASASSDLTVSLESVTPSTCSASGNTATLLALGKCTIAANQAGNSDYLAAHQVERTFTIGLAPQTITFAPLSSMTYGAAAFGVSATASSTLAVSFTSTTSTVCTVLGSTVTLAAAGTCSIKATQAGNNYYAAAAAVTHSFAVRKEAQTISFSTISATPLSTGSVSLYATASSGLTVSVASKTPTICLVSGDTANLLAAGKCTIAATQAGDADYLAAPAVDQTFTVTAN
jgi:hypothetical protein